MNDSRLEDINHREIDEHRRSTLYVAGLSIALVIVIMAVIAATAMVAQVVSG